MLSRLIPQALFCVAYDLQQQRFDGLADLWTFLKRVQERTPQLNNADMLISIDVRPRCRNRRRSVEDQESLTRCLWFGSHYL
jgi:hypothetical protein